MHDQPRSGRPPLLTATEQALATHYIHEEPRSLKRVIERLAQRTGKRLSISSLKCLVNEAQLRWKRIRKSLKSLRNPLAFARAKCALEALHGQEDAGDIARYYCDESGFTLDPYLPSAWQEQGTVLEIPARREGRINVLGFMNRQNAVHPFLCEQSVTTPVVVACFDAFSQTLTQKTVVVLDNASMHTSEEFRTCLENGEERVYI